MKFQIVTLALAASLFVSCSNTTTTPVEPPKYDATPYSFDAKGLPVPKLPVDNALTQQKVELGRMLFHETMLSKDNTQACASCHKQADGFSDIRQFSIGVQGLPGKRQAMPIFNMAWHTDGFFWDGRAPLLRDQALRPIQDVLEMNETLPNVIKKLSDTEKYRFQFIRAFGNDTINELKISLALEQFMLTIVSGNSKFDKMNRGQTVFTDQEERGRKLFFTEFDPMNKVKGAECFHCHGGTNFTNNNYINNGLDDDAGITDLGRYEVTKVKRDWATFKVPSLRNVALTPPYMHDGRLASLEEVVDHYATGVKKSISVDFQMQYNLQPGGLKLSEQDKDDLVAFLNTLTDADLAANTAFGAPK
ncbi:MAG: c-type cytochrome [Ignavibacteria bacterium]|nr:c-type cytochrome [Ignavibacteria bacterium]